tara:strand:- start:1002 stop:1931 length:930 start_codon:yes stop_codon:yes gene_type:complete
MCAGIGNAMGSMSPGMGAGLGFGMDTLGHLGGYFEDKRNTRLANQEIQRQNQLKINAYKTKQRNAELAWNNDKMNADIAVDNKWRESQDAIAEAQLNAKRSAGQAAISQQRILAKLMASKGTREQVGRRSGRKGIAEAGAEMAAIGAKAAFDKKSEILFRDKTGRNIAAFAQGKYVEYITGRPSPEATPLLQAKKSMPSFFNTAVKIASSGLDRYQQYQDKKAPDAYNSDSLKIGGGSFDDYGEGAFQQQPSWNFDASQTPSASWQTEVPSFTSSADTFIQQDMNNYFSAQRANKASNDLGANLSNTFL